MDELSDWYYVDVEDFKDYVEKNGVSGLLEFYGGPQGSPLLRTDT